MDFTFTPVRVAVLVALLVVFALLGGFSLPEPFPPRMGRAWALSILLFTLGAISSTVVDHWVGNLDRSNLRWFYIIVGIAAMAGGLMNLHVLRERVKINEETSSVSW